jgi:lipopolysaccharide transport system ATP-binding protein
VSIVVEGLSKRYWLHAGRPQTFQQALGEMAGALQRGRPFWALRDVSFRVEAGESVAVIGDNGAGKSTLLRLLCGLGRPTSGSTRVLGRVTALLELGAGFHRLLSGRENLYVSAIVSGMRRREVEAPRLQAWKQEKECSRAPHRIWRIPPRPWESTRLAPHRRPRRHTQRFSVALPSLRKPPAISA